MLNQNDKVSLVRNGILYVGTIASEFNETSVTVQCVGVGCNEPECHPIVAMANQIRLLTDSEWIKLTRFEPAFDPPAIRSLRHYAESEIQGTDLRGNPARDACKILLKNWAAELAAGSTDNLPADIDLVIDYLRTFQDKARELLPIANGGAA